MKKEDCTGIHDIAISAHCCPHARLVCPIVLRWWEKEHYISHTPCSWGFWIWSRFFRLEALLRGSASALNQAGSEAASGQASIRFWSQSFQWWLLHPQVAQDMWPWRWWQSQPWIADKSRAMVSWFPRVLTVAETESGLPVSDFLFWIPYCLK